MNNFNMNMTIKPTWEIVQDVHEKTLRVMSDQGSSRDTQESTMMVATELIENAVKYGSSQPDGSNIEFNLEICNDFIEMSTANGVTNEEHAHIVLDMINKINESENPQELYTQRLLELMEMEKPGGATQLGIYRIAYEGKFNLRCRYEDQLLTINASKTLK